MNLVYIGTKTHDEDLLLILNALKQIKGVKEDKISITCIGVTRFLESNEIFHTISIPTQNVKYPNYVNWVQKNVRGKYQIGLAPLKHTDFNACKSDIKLLEYISLGLVPVYSDCVAYQYFVDRQIGQAVRNNHYSWTNALLEVVDNYDSHYNSLQEQKNRIFKDRDMNTISDSHRQLLSTQLNQ